MSRKTHSISAAAILAATSLTLASAETSGAFAQDQQDISAAGMETTKTAADGSEKPAPQFVSEEIIQPLPEDAAQKETQSDETAPSAASLRELVSSTGTDYALSEQMKCLAGAIYFESRGEPLAGQLAVAQVIINRADSSSFPSSYCGVVYQRSQFSFVKGGRMPSIRTNSAAWRKAKAIAKIAHEGQWESEAADSLYFHAKYVRPSWSRKKVARATINTHIFYR
ncbi:Cell wall hydrolyses involved in spore germination [Altererythrobacter epoxidivorans]|uniref:Cell wall hydrolyses involved in spore germination n=1 Tax=Altererythrobacter epoxidivorans TaxID=361183 RepID=A0A0M4MJ05_9SPHN|nr:cell wall hydrolase [Altererythrobacter epoxidivorans]ALE17805.1 Cell wall hydrolyses involved in spore germination [Altererythrobacter epoxidivorans]